MPLVSAEINGGYFLCCVCSRKWL